MLPHPRGIEAGGGRIRRCGLPVIISDDSRLVGGQSRLDDICVGPFVAFRVSIRKAEGADLAVIDAEQAGKFLPGISAASVGLPGS